MARVLSSYYAERLLGGGPVRSRAQRSANLAGKAVTEYNNAIRSKSKIPTWISRPINPHAARLGEIKEELIFFTLPEFRNWDRTRHPTKQERGAWAKQQEVTRLELLSEQRTLLSEQPPFPYPDTWDKGETPLQVLSYMSGGGTRFVGAAMEYRIQCENAGIIIS
jgi:hypothetical protein